jgi:hypothetical protein
MYLAFYGCCSTTDALGLGASSRPVPDLAEAPLCLAGSLAAQHSLWVVRSRDRLFLRLAEQLGVLIQAALRGRPVLLGDQRMRHRPRSCVWRDLLCVGAGEGKQQACAHDCSLEFPHRHDSHSFLKAVEGPAERPAFGLYLPLRGERRNVFKTVSNKNQKFSISLFL